jgi:predicted RNA binding protein YcfA (HicA-like mRNA interferase family)
MLGPLRTHHRRLTFESRADHAAELGTLEAGIEAEGWRLTEARGAHRQYAHPTKRGRVTVAGDPDRDVPAGTAANLLRPVGPRRPDR